MRLRMTVSTRYCRSEGSEESWTQQDNAYLGVLAVDGLGADDCRVGHDGEAS